MSRPRMSRAFASASAGSSASLTPPALPRPPVSTCALTTTCPPISSAAVRASSGVVARRPSDTGMPKRLKSSLPWYSCRSTAARECTHARPCDGAVPNAAALLAMPLQSTAGLCPAVRSSRIRARATVDASDTLPGPAAAERFADLQAEALEQAGYGLRSHLQAVARVQRRELVRVCLDRPAHAVELLEEFLEARRRDD